MKNKLTLTAFLLTTCLVGCYGCQPIKTSPADATGEAITRADVRNQSIEYHVKKVTPKVNGDEKVHLQTAEQDLQNQKGDLKEANQELNRFKTDYNKEHDELTKIKQGLFYRAGLWFSRLWKVLLGALVAGLVLRTISMAVGGPAGTILALISTAIFGFLSGGLSMIQSLFDNIHFRFRAANNTDQKAGE